MPKVTTKSASPAAGMPKPARKSPVRVAARPTVYPLPVKEKMSMRSAVKLLIWTVLVGAIVLGCLNWGFTAARISYFFHKPNPATVIQPKLESPAPQEGSWPKDTLAIPSLGVNAPVIYDVASNEDAFQVALQSGVVHYPGSALPGAVGNVYIFGHSSDYAWSKGEYKAVFALLPKIKNGAEIKLTDSKGFMYTYLVTNQFVVGPKDVSVLSQDTKGKRILTVQTSYPIGTALKRYVVQAELRQSD